MLQGQIDSFRRLLLLMQRNSIRDNRPPLCDCCAIGGAVDYRDCHPLLWLWEIGDLFPNRGSTMYPHRQTSSSVFRRHPFGWNQHCSWLQFFLSATLRNALAGQNSCRIYRYYMSFCFLLFSTRAGFALVRSQPLNLTKHQRAIFVLWFLASAQCQISMLSQLLIRLWYDILNIYPFYSPELCTNSLRFH